MNIRTRSTSYHRKPAFARTDGLLIGERRAVRAARDLQLALLELVQALLHEPGSDTQGWLVLPDTGLTLERVRREWEAFTRILSPELGSRVHIALGDRPPYGGVPGAPRASLAQLLAGDRVNDSARSTTQPRTRAASFVIAKHLLARRLDRSGPTTTRAIAEMTGYSYPTIARELKSYGSLLKRESDRRVALRWFPREMLHRVATQAGAARRTARYNVSAPPRASFESYIERLQKLAVPGLALGGVLGALHHVPDLDITGPPRLDLCIHSPSGQPRLDFIPRLDPALELVTDPLAPAAVVVHVVSEQVPQYSPRDGGLAWAAPMDCLLDLLEMPLPAQAQQFIEVLEQEGAPSP